MNSEEKEDRWGKGKSSNIVEVIVNPILRLFLYVIQLNYAPSPTLFSFLKLGMDSRIVYFIPSVYIYIYIIFSFPNSYSNLTFTYLLSTQYKHYIYICKKVQKSLQKRCKITLIFEKKKLMRERK